MELNSLIYEDKTWWVATLPAVFEIQNMCNTWLIVYVFSMIAFLAAFALLLWVFSNAGPAWKNCQTQMGCVQIPGTRGLPIFGSLFTLSRGLAHRTLAAMAASQAATQLMAFSLGSTPAVVASDPVTAREILTSPHFADRPIKQSARLLMFSRAIGFSPNGAYWRLLRRIAASHLFAPKRILAHESGRRLDCAAMLTAVQKDQAFHGFVALRKHLQVASLNNIMGIVFGKRYDTAHDSEESRELREIVREGFDLLGAFNWSDHLPWLSCFFYDPFQVNERCLALVPRVRRIVEQIIAQHRVNGPMKLSDTSDFVDVLLSLDGQEKLQDDDIIAVLWEMIFRGTDTTALLTEWVMAELVLNPEVQAKLQQELQTLTTAVADADESKVPYLQAVVKETLRMHPPGPLLSWSRLSTSNVHLSNGMVIPANTTAMVNMWAITHDPRVWEDPLLFKPERFLTPEAAGADLREGDLRLAPFGAGRRGCPGKNLGLVTVSLWVAELVRHFKWVEDGTRPVDLSEVLKLSCEMKNPLSVVAVPRVGASTF
ncbi:cytochrome P450 78A7-like [Diospyros lotus]|uniref:cytochrome P450 78A7-like n=1 Tax=Diospyros lotus TaxID=55363 RepID=UPI002255688E|nr:cytochrome P450 78A7-like [Diospyros lotus]